MSRVISSSPSFVVRASISYSSMWIEVSSSSLTRRLREDDRVLEVVALPGHEGDHAGSCRAPSRPGRSRSRRRARRPSSTWSPVIDARLLVDQRALVGALELLQLVLAAPVLALDDDLLGVDVRDRAVDLRRAARRRCRCAARRSMPVPISGASVFEQRHGLALHVRAHQRAVGVVVLEERDHRRRDRPDLLGRDVDQVDVLRARPVTYWPACVRQTTSGPLSLPVFSSTGVVGLRDQPLRLLVGVEVDDLVGDDAVLDHAVGRRDEAVARRPRRSSTASRSGRCSGPPASRSGTCGRSGSGGRRGPRWARARGSGRRRRAPTGGGGA